MQLYITAEILVVIIILIKYFTTNERKNEVLNKVMGIKQLNCSLLKNSKN